MNETLDVNSEPTGPSRNPVRVYVIVALILVVVIVVAGVLLVVKWLPTLRGTQEPTATVELTPTLAPTYTLAPTKEPTNTPLPSPSPTPEPPVMLDTDSPLYALDSAGARPGAEWTGFFGVVWNAQENPVSGVSVVVWYRDGTQASPVVKTDDAGQYEIRLADAPLAGSWSIQLLKDDGLPASKLFTFNTDENTETGVQQIQVIWKENP